ncbi:MAG: DUF885 domain-containing protein [Candidatus Limnocylindrales bacterium]|jgi:uncharacterized protein (DUF885 family)
MADFDELVDEFLRHEFEESPVAASGLGLTEYDDRLDDLSAAAFDRRQARAAEWGRRFAALPDAKLSSDERIDRDLAVAMMAGRSIMAEWLPWRRDPVTYSGPIANGLFGLFLHRLRPEPELVDAAVARLGQARRALEQGRANLDPQLAHPLILDRGRDAARGTARYVRELLPAEAGTDPDRARLADAGAEAARALEAWAGHLDEMSRAASGSWQLGEERYTRLLREREALPYDARSLRDRGRAEYDRLCAEMRELSRSAWGTGDWNAVLERSNEDHPATEEAMRQAYADWTVRARTFLADTGLITIPEGESCAVLPSPPFQRPLIGVASYQQPPAFAPSLRGHFFVPFAPEGASPQEIGKRLAANSFGHIPTTTVHEAYPGHHWHLVVRKARARRLRRVLGTPYFTEGWGLYAERMMRERGFFTEPIQELNHLKATLFRAARIVVDTSLHLGEMSHEEAVRFMVEKTATPEPTARAEVGRYCWWPTQASAYLTGCLEILRIRDRFLESRGVTGPAATAAVEVMRDFHDRMAESGSLPLGLAEKALLGAASASAT